jgi:pantothenate kinase
MELADLTRRITALERAKPGQRVIIGIAGTPGSGKSTLAGNLVAALSGRGSGPRAWIGSPAAHVPMDGFHLADVELSRLGRTDRKGAPDTFDPAGYQALLQRLRTSTETVWAPGFDRELEQPIAGAVPVLPGTRVIITEGNYLLLPDPEWAGISELLDETWFCTLEDRLRLERLVARHERFGKPAALAREWAYGPDERNAALVRASQDRADLVIDGDVGT